jgi:DNA helicase-2/ATP-dependent DNA helicase PcrA
MYVGITRAMRLLTLTYARRRAVYGGAPNYGLPSRFLAELPPDLIDREGSGATSWSRAAVSGGTPRPRLTSWGDASPSGQSGSGGGGVSAPFRTGDDVVHAAFGDGVVLATEPGGIVVVRFAQDGTERKLMAEYAPIQKR